MPSSYSAVSITVCQGCRLTWKWETTKLDFLSSFYSFQKIIFSLCCLFFFLSFSFGKKKGQSKHLVKGTVSKLGILGNNLCSVDSGLGSVCSSSWNNTVWSCELFNIVHSGPCTETHFWVWEWTSAAVPVPLGSRNNIQEITGK